MDKIVDSVRKIDFGDCTMPMITVYSNPKDYPGKVVARVYDVDKPTNAVIVKDSLKELEEDLLAYSNMIPIGRTPEDDKTVIGVWI